MSLVLYNTLTRKKEKFVPWDKGKVGLYTCGPTVYHYAHIGNLRSYIFEDILRRTLLFNEYNVKHVMNITDVGHLTSDADMGEDKMLKGARRDKKTVWEVANFYTKAFQQDMKKLNILAPKVWCKATDHIKEQIEMIQVLEKKKFTYFSGGNVYFDTSKVKDYGTLALLNVHADKKARVQEDLHKKNPHDFVLWFTKSKFEEQEMKWNSPWGKGYPGWHIECSAMASKYLGKQFDIHCGGIDHIPVHHTNEIAQSEAAFGVKPWVKYWLHNEFLILNQGERMAKSGDNFVTLQTLEEKGFDPLDYRYFCLGTHYRNPLMFNYEALEGARQARRRLMEKVLELKREKEKKENKLLQQKYREQFTEEIGDDLNTPQVLATVWEVLRDETLSSRDKLKLIYPFDEILGLKLKSVKGENIPEQIFDLAEERERARQKKDWKRADALREKIKSLGYVVGDTKEGFQITKL